MIAYGFDHPGETVIVKRSSSTPTATATPGNKRSLLVMAGLVPAIHVVVQLYITKSSKCGQMLQNDAGKPLRLLEFNRVDGQDEPGHDGVERDRFRGRALARTAS
jgi:hypothetical protein